GVHVLRGYGGWYPANVMAVARRVDIPLILSVHDSNAERLSENVCVADLVLCTSRVVAETVRARGVCEGAIRILPNRVDRKRFCPNPDDPGALALRARFPWRNGILHVARYSPEKNLKTVIAALAHLGPEFGLVAVGLGDAALYRQQAEAQGVADRCVLLGPVPNAELPSFYRWCSCMCVPSRREGFGIVFIEAMACGATVVTSAIAPMTEYIQDGVNGILVEAFEDPRAVATAIQRACQDPAGRTIGVAARESTRCFAVEAVDALEVEYYREALARGGGRPGPAEASSWWGRLLGALPW
ncbi:MAG TPA: glycosyltransferase, partial [Candidatus Methylomirabilis sp.]|nr:glycosyltransferase [Candidatus Methylomirabilis sp.]